MEFEKCSPIAKSLRIKKGLIIQGHECKNAIKLVTESLSYSLHQIYLLILKICSINRFIKRGKV